jgi:hypothetical protein
MLHTQLVKDVVPSTEAVDEEMTLLHSRCGENSSGDLKINHIVGKIELVCLCI